MVTTSSRVHDITSVRRALSEEVNARSARYLVTMLVRTGCLLACALVPTWHRWIFAAGAILLPLFAVMVANAGREPVGKIARFQPGFETDESARTLGSLGLVIGTDIDTAVAPILTDSSKTVSGSALELHSSRPRYLHDDTEFLR